MSKKQEEKDTKELSWEKEFDRKWIRAGILPMAEALAIKKFIHQEREKVREKQEKEFRVKGKTLLGLAKNYWGYRGLSAAEFCRQVENVFELAREK